MKTAIYTTYISITALSLILTLLGVIFCDSMLIVLNTNAEIMADSADYLRIYTLGLAFLFVYNIATCVFSSLGDSKTPLVLLICSSVGNVILDLVLVEGFGMGVGSLALATLIAQGAASVAATLILFYRLRKIETPKKPRIFSVNALGKISRLAVPGIFQQSFVSVGNLFVQSLINGFGDPAVIAGFAAVNKINTFSVTMIVTIAGGISNFTAQNIGAGKPERVKSGYKAGLIMSECLAALLTLISVIFSRQLMGLFVEEPTETVISTGTDFLLIVAPFYFTVTAKLVADNILKGSGTMVFFMISTFTDLILRVGLAYIFAGFMGVVGVWWSWPVGWAVAAVVSQIFYHTGLWRRRHNV